MHKLSIQLKRKSFTRNGESFTVIQDLQFQTSEGRMTVVLGTSGCGKSTLLRVIGGLDKDFEGRVERNGGSITPGDIGIVFQDIRLFPWKSVRSNIRFAASRPGEITEKEIDRLLELVHLRGVDNVLPKNLSGGMAQRAALARALVGNPGILLLDEPFSSVDSFMRHSLQSELWQIVQEKQIICVFVTHDLDEALFLADQIVFLPKNPSRGAITTEVLLEHPRRRLSDEFAGERVRIANLVMETMQEEVL